MRPSPLLERLAGRLAALPLRGKFSQDVAWNLASFGVLAVSGVALNVLIGRFYGADALGAFNQVLALYIFVSQFAVFGIHYSVAKYVAEFAADGPRCDAIVSAALAATALCAAAACAAGWALSPAVGWAFGSAAVATGWLWVLPGLWCFSLNKVLLGVLNGRRMMKLFAVCQATRYVLFIALLVCCVVWRAPGPMLPAIVSGAELALMLFLLACVLRLHRVVGPRRWAGWARRHLGFGARGFLSGTMTELNSRVDVLMLGLFTSDRAVGIYSMASLLVEGFAELTVVVRNNVNPLLTQYITQGRLDELQELVRRGVRIVYAVLAVLGALAVVLYPVVIRVLVGDEAFVAGWAPFAILMAGLVLCSGYLPFAMILVQGGFPGTHTLLRTAIVLTNGALNAALIPWLGLHGAALATAAALVLSAVYLKRLTRRTLGVRI